MLDYQSYRLNLLRAKECVQKCQTNVTEGSLVENTEDLLNTIDALLEDVEDNIKDERGFI